MEIDENLKYTLYVTPVFPPLLLKLPFEFDSFPLADVLSFSAYNLTPAHEPVNRRYRDGRRTTSFRFIDRINPLISVMTFVPFIFSAITQYPTLGHEFFLQCQMR